MTTVLFQIAGMHCDHCVRSVKSALTRLEGVQRAEVEIGQARVWFDESLHTRNDLINAIRVAGGFDVTGFQSL